MTSNARLSREQFEALTALCDTLVPAIDVPDDPHGFWKRRASDLAIPELIVETVFTLQDEVSQAQLKQLLGALSHPISSAIITGRFKRFADLPLDEREAILRGWSVSPIGFLRQSFQAIKRLTHVLFYSALDADGQNPNWAAIDYPIKPLLQRRPAAAIQPLPINDDLTLECDAVVVGSGAGGGVVAGELARAGKSVIVLEKGGYFNEASFPDKEIEAYQQLYENQGILATRDLGVVVLAGSTLGGGTTINWSASFRTPDYVLREWARDFGLKAFTGGEYQASLEAVCQRLNVGTDETKPRRVDPAQRARLRRHPAVRLLWLRLRARREAGHTQNLPAGGR
jgi:hypothetical protein